MSAIGLTGAIGASCDQTTAGANKTRPKAIAACGTNLSTIKQPAEPILSTAEKAAARRPPGAVCGNPRSVSSRIRVQNCGEDRHLGGSGQQPATLQPACAACTDRRRRPKRDAIREA